MAATSTDPHFDHDPQQPQPQRGPDGSAVLWALYTQSEIITNLFLNWIPPHDFILGVEIMALNQNTLLMTSARTDLPLRYNMTSYVHFTVYLCSSSVQQCASGRAGFISWAPFREKHMEEALRRSDKREFRQMAHDVGPYLCLFRPYVALRFPFIGQPELDLLLDLHAVKMISTHAVEDLRPRLILRDGVVSHVFQQPQQSIRSVTEWRSTVLIEIPIYWRPCVFFFYGRKSFSSVLHFYQCPLAEQVAKTLACEETLLTPCLVALGLWCENVDAR
ncbi:hypothetical protein F2P81_003703 [Scophthalmus maximus]|uniref:Uncharacterized protein n=1 Tax=Scophthalmus maximus TaxID=52904 RepID=A0A6A4TH56_SCOMX|nr:hypothetical protein F2P81_003703 [Scophthalmus maximus]